MAVTIVRSLIFASLALSVYMMVFTLQRCRSEKRYLFVYSIVAMFLYTLGYFIEITSGTLGGGIVAVKIMYAGGCFMTPFFFFFIADYCELSIPKKYYMFPLLIIPILFYGIVLTFENHQYLYASFSYNSAHTIPGMDVEPGSMYLIGTFYPIFCIWLSVSIIAQNIVKQNKSRRLPLILLLISCLAPVIANLSYVAISFFYKGPFAGINFTPFVLAITNFLFFYNVVRNDMFDLAPKALAVTLDLIRDAFVVLDRDMSYTGSNKNAVELFPALAELQKGTSIQGLHNWPEELTIVQGGTDAASAHREVEFTLPHMEGKHYSGWINRVDSNSDADSGLNTIIGWVILIQDITETVSLIRNIRSQRDEIAAMRDNLKEGLFLMDREFKIQPSYSKALEEILAGKRFQGEKFTDLLAKSYKPKDIDTIADYFTMIMDNALDAETLEDMNPLVEFSYISAETGIHKTLRCLFAPVDQGNGEIFVMGTIQDISAETALKKRLAEESERRQDEMRNLFEVMQVDQKVFEDFIEDTDDEFGRVNLLIQNKQTSNRELLVSLYQLVHAIKSNALIVGLSGYGEKLHALETAIKNLREKEEEPDFDEILHITVELEKLNTEKEKLEETLKRLRNFSASGKAENKKDDDVFIESLRQVCEKVAASEQKKAVFAVETFDRDALARKQRRVIKEILTQLVRNAVYHGIETPEERIALGKDETGTISLSLTIESDCIHIILKDDGRGLDFDRIAQEAELRGLLHEPAAEKTNKQFLSGLIFSPGFSTSETENLNAGRGIGLNLVRDRLKEVRGSVQLQNIQGQGLVFDIKIPLKDA